MTQMDTDSIIGSSNSSSINNISNQSPHLIQQYNWYYDKSELKKTPSKNDNISYELERLYRNEGARFILNAGSQMRLRYDTLATGVVYFHRFYMQHSFKVFPRYVTAACCLFLAGKAEETPKKIRDIIKIAKTLLDPQQFATFGENQREEVLTLERIVLQTIRFDLQVEHPYKYLVNYAKCFKGNKDNIQEVLQMAWTFTNDSLCTTICLQWEPEIVAIAMIFLASKIRYEITDWEGRLPHQKYWWDIYVEDLNIELLEDICHQVLDLYSKPSEELTKSPPLPNSPKTPTRQAQPSKAENTTPMKTFPVNTTTIQPIKIRQGINLPQSTTSSNGQAQVPTPPIIPPPPPAPAIACPPMPPQWDPNLAATFYSKYNYPIIGLQPNASISLVPPPPPPPITPVIGPIGTHTAALTTRLPPPPFVQMNQHQSS